MKKERIIEVLENARDEDLFRIINEYADAVNDDDYRIYNMDGDFDIMFEGRTPLDVADLVLTSDHFEVTDKYFRFTWYGEEVESMDWLDDLGIEEDIADAYLRDETQIPSLAELIYA